MNGGLPMALIADTHIHIYPSVDAALLIEHAMRRLRHLSPKSGDIVALFLAEGRGHDVFSSLSNNAVDLSGMSVAGHEESEALLLKHKSLGEVWVFAGRQIVTAEKLEVLALTMQDVVEDGQPIGRVIDSVIETGGIPVLSWAPGKWFSRRGEVVEKVINEYKPGRILIGDTSLRPLGWPEPSVMKRASAMGFGIIAGSDPLPIHGEERQAGRYAARCELSFDSCKPVTSVRSGLKDPSIRIDRIGRRNSWPEMLSRLYRHHSGKRRENAG